MFVLLRPKLFDLTTVISYPNLSALLVADQGSGRLVMARALNLYLQWITATARKFLYDWAKEVVVLACGGIFIGLLIYIAQDFLNLDINSLTLTEQMKKSASVIAWLILWATCTRNFASPTNNAVQLHAMALRLGETPTVIRTFQLHYYVTQCLFFAAFYLFLTLQFFYQWSPPLLILQVLLGSVLASTLGTFIRNRRPVHQPSSQPIKSTPLVARSLVHWRVLQIISRNRTAQLCLALSLTGLLASGLLGLREAPSLLLNLCSFISGCFLAATIALQAQEDMKQAWFEKHLGMSHDRYLSILRSCAIVLCIASASVLILINLAVDTPFTTLLKSLGCLAIPVLMMPYLVFQIDPRRPWIQMIMVVVLGLVIATAWHAHWLGILVLPLFIYYAAQHCAGRYYRA